MEEGIRICGSEMNIAATGVGREVSTFPIQEIAAQYCGFGL